MPRGKRLIVPNCPHHIVQRGHDRKAVFVCDDDYKHYLSTLAETKKALGVAIYAYCLMTNHVNLIVDPKDQLANKHGTRTGLRVAQVRCGRVVISLA